MSITGIRDRQIIKIDDEELLEVVGAALGGDLQDQGQGAYEAKSWLNKDLEPAGAIFNAAFGGRRFFDLQSLAACAVDLQSEQIQMHKECEKRLTDALRLCANKLSAEDIRKGLDPSHELDEALAALAYAAGESDA